MRRILKHCCVLAAALSATAAHGKPASISEQATFEKAIAAVRADADNYDKFKEPVQTGLDGRSFKITLPVDSDVMSAGVSYDYTDGKLVLKLVPNKGWPLFRSPSESLPYVVVESANKNLGSYIGQNAYGATARVKSLKNLAAGIALVTAPRTVSRTRETMGIPITSEKGWFAEVQLPPSEAKVLSRDVALVIEGTDTKVPWGDAGFCDFSGSNATLDAPLDYYSQKCFLGANVARIAFVNMATGAVLKEWTTATDPAVGPVLWGAIRVGMDKYQLKAAYPSITDYGYLEADHVQVTMTDELVSGVQVRSSIVGAGKALLNQLTAQYGTPVTSKCITENLCQASWRLNNGVAAYLGIDGEMVYQMAGEPPPIGFRY